MTHNSFNNNFTQHFPNAKNCFDPETMLTNGKKIGKVPISGQFECLVENGKFGNINITSSSNGQTTVSSSKTTSSSAPSFDRCIASTLMDAFKKSLTFNECGFPTLDLPKGDLCLSELVLKYEKKKTCQPPSSSASSAKNGTSTAPSPSSATSSSSSLHKTFCIACTTREVVPQAKPTNDFFGYFSELLCSLCIEKLKKTKEFGSAQAKAKKMQLKAKSSKERSALEEEKKMKTLLPELQLLKENVNFKSKSKSKTSSVDDENNMYWMEVRNAIYQVFLEEGFTLNDVLTKYINPPVCHYCMPSNAMLRNMVKRLYHAHHHKFFLLTVCHVQLFIMEIKLTLLKELMHLERPYFIFAIFYTLFQRLLRALQRTNLFLDIIETEFLKKNALHWLQIHFLFFQTFVYMNRFIQKSISLLCDCSLENGLKTDDSDESRLVGKIVYRSYIILEQSMASFSIYTNANSSNFAVFFSKFDDVSLKFQMLFQFAILLFNCKNYDENIFAKRFFSADFAVKSLQSMPTLPADLLTIDALNTVAFQLFLVIHHWDSTEVFDNVMRRLPTVECSRSSRSIIKTILTESFIEVGYDERQLLADFYAYMQVNMPPEVEGETSFEALLAQEIALSDEDGVYGDEEDLEGLDEEGGGCLSEDGGSSSCPFRHGHGGGGSGFGSCYPHDCDCYADMFCGSGSEGHHHGHHHGGHFPPPPPPSRRSLEVRERLRQKISTRRQRVGNGQQAENDASNLCLEHQQLQAHLQQHFQQNPPPTDDRKIDDLLSFINGDDEERDGNNKKRKSKAKKKPKSKKQKNKDGSKSNDQTETDFSLVEVKEVKEEVKLQKKVSKPLQFAEEEDEEDFVQLRRHIRKAKKLEKGRKKIKEDSNSRAKNSHHRVSSFTETSFNSKAAVIRTPTPTTEDVICDDGFVLVNEDIKAEDNEDDEEDDDLEDEDENGNDNENVEDADDENEEEEDEAEDDEQFVELGVSFTNPEEVFMPKDIDLDSEDIDDFEKDLERFKRICYDTISSYDSCKLKLAINVKEIFSRKASVGGLHK